MIEKFVIFCLKNRFLVIFMVLAIGAIGVRAVNHLPIDAVPDVTNVQVQVLTNAPSLGPVEVEQYVTVPIERVMSGLPHVEKVRSLSRFGLSAITIVFEEGTDIFFARQLVSERLSEAREVIPKGYGSPALGPITSGLGEIYQFEVRANTMCDPDLINHKNKNVNTSTKCHSLMDLREILDWYISFQLRPIPGVVEVNSFGGELKTYEVQVDPDRLNALGLSLRDVFTALEKNNANEGGGYIIRGGEQRVIRGEGLIRNLDDVRQIVIATRADGTAIFIRDIGNAVFAAQIRQGAVTRDGRGEIVTGTVMMLTGANSGAVSKAVKKRIEEISPGLPEGVSIETYYDRSTLVNRTIRTVVTNLIEGGVLVILILLLMLGNIRGSLLVAVVIPLSLLVTFISMRFFNVSGNLMSLGALDFGLIIDGAIVVIENITRRLSSLRKRDKMEIERTIKEATLQVVRPVIFGASIIMIVYLPILYLRGIEGKMFVPMAIAVLSALAAGLVLAVTLVPVVSTWIFKNGIEEKEPWLAKSIRKVYEPALVWALVSKKWVIGIAIALLVLGAFLASTMGAEFIPRLDEGAIAMQAVRPPSVSLEESIVATTRIEQLLKYSFPDEIETVVSRTGRAEIATDPMGVEVSDIYIMLNPKEEWTKVESKDALVEAIERQLEKEILGQNFSFSQPIELRTNELISGVRSDIAISVYGEDFRELEDAGKKIMEILQNIKGTADVNVDQVAGLPSLRIIVDRSAAARYGLNTSEILDAVAAVGGRKVGMVFEGQRRFTMQVRLKKEARENEEQLRSLLISARGGKRIPLGQVAKIKLDEGPAVVSRDTAQRRITIQVNVRGRDLAGYISEAQDKVRKASFPVGYFVKWGGQYENLRAATSRLMIAVPAALLLIFILLFTTFRSFRPTFIIYLNIPMAAVGGIFALWIRDMPFSISAAIGFIALSGIAVLNGVVMVTYIRELQAEGLSLLDATEKGARLRLRAVMMTALTDGIGFLPMAISLSAGAEVQQPLATVVIGGLITSTFLTLFVLPVIYSVWGGDVQNEQALNGCNQIHGIEAHG